MVPVCCVRRMSADPAATWRGTQLWSAPARGNVAPWIRHTSTRGGTSLTRADRIRVVLLDDRSVTREGLRALLEREHDIEVALDASQVDEVMALDGDPDVIVSELVLREMRGASIIGSLRRRFCQSAILVLTVVDDLREVEAAFAAGANGYSMKYSASREVVEAIRKVWRGEEYVEPGLGAALARRAEWPGNNHGDALTAREREVLRLLALGHTNAEIADRLSISLRTSEAHRANLMQKLGVRTRAELVRCALERGLLGPPR